jgi:predicted MFS family arabinose efflux permease
MNALFVQGAGANERGRAMALYNLSFSLGTTLAAFLAGEIAQRFGYGTMWRAVAVSALIGSAALFLDREQPLSDAANRG